MNRKRPAAHDPPLSARCAKQQRTALFDMHGETQSPASAGTLDLSSRWKRVLQDFKEVGRDTLLLIRGDCPLILESLRFSTCIRSRRTVGFSFNFPRKHNTAPRTITNTLFLTRNYISYLGCCYRSARLFANYPRHGKILCCFTKLLATYKPLRQQQLFIASITTLFVHASQRIIISELRD